MRLVLVSVIAVSSGLGWIAVSTIQDVASPGEQSDIAGSEGLWLDLVAADGVVEGGRPEAALRLEVDGVLATVLVDENQDVHKGDLLAELGNQVQQEQVALANAELTVAQARLERLRNGERSETRKAAHALEESRRLAFERFQADWRRIQKLTARNNASPEERDGAYYAMVQAQAEWDEAAAGQELVEAPPRAEDLAEAEGHVAVAEARLRLAEAELEKTRLFAPRDGRVLRLYAEPGEAVGPLSAEPVLLLADLSRHRVRAFVEELDAARVHPGQAAAVTADGLPGRTYTGHVAMVASRMGRRAPESDAPGEYKDLYFREVIIDLDSGDELPVNLRVQVQIHVNAAPETSLGGSF